MTLIAYGGCAVASWLNDYYLDIVADDDDDCCCCWCGCGYCCCCCDDTDCAMRHRRWIVIHSNDCFRHRYDDGVGGDDCSTSCDHKRSAADAGIDDEHWTGFLHPSWILGNAAAVAAAGRHR